MHSEEIIDLENQKLAEEKSHKKIAERLNLSKSTVQYMINNSYNWKKCKTGPKPALSKTEKYKIGVEFLRLKNFKKLISSQKLKISCTLKASSATLRRQLNREGLKYSSKPKTLVLTQIQKEKRMENCECWIADRVEWQKVVFSEEKIQSRRNRGQFEDLDVEKRWVGVEAS